MASTAARPISSLRRFDAAFSAFLARAAGLDATVIVTADHGFIDSPPDRVIELDDHPALQATLRLPLCGERRAAYCYVQPGQAQDFERLRAQTCSPSKCGCARSETLIAAGLVRPRAAAPEVEGARRRLHPGDARQLDDQGLDAGREAAPPYRGARRRERGRNDGAAGRGPAVATCTRPLKVRAKPIEL